MPTYRLSFTVNSTNITKVQKQVKDAFGVDLSVLVAKQGDTPAARIEHAGSLVEEAKGILEDVRTDLEDSRDNIPENLRGGERAEKLDEAIRELESREQELEDIDLTTVEI